MKSKKSVHFFVDLYQLFDGNEPGQLYPRL